MQELRQMPLDFLCFCLRSGEPEQGVVGLCRASGADRVRWGLVSEVAVPDRSA